MSFFIKGNYLSEKYNAIEYKVSVDIKKELDTDSVYNKDVWKPK